MFSRTDLVAFGIFVLIALVAALGTYVILDLSSPDPDSVSVSRTTRAMAPAPSTPRTVTTQAPQATATPVPTSIPYFGHITFGTELNGDQVLHPGSTFPAGTERVYASWNYQNMPDGTLYHVSWLLDDSPWSYESFTWSRAERGSEGVAHADMATTREAGGLPPGNYRLELYIEDRLVQLASFVVLGPTPTLPIPTSTPLPSAIEIGRKASRSLVQIWVEDERGEWGGSGSIVDGENGLILTNWHVVTDDSGNLPNEEGYVRILLTQDPDRYPVLTYWARVLAEFSDPDNDLALLRITHRTSDNSPVQTPLDLPAIPLGDSDRVRRGDRALLLGYPDFGEGGLTWTEGVIAARTAEWIKSSAEASYGHSGGMMLNSRGELVGIITGFESVGLQAQLTLARPVNSTTPLIGRALTGLQDGSSAPPTSRDRAGNYMVVLGTGALNLRQEPRLDARPLVEMKMGTTVEVLGEPKWDGERDWYHVRLLDSDQMGWASEFFLAPMDIARTPLLFTSNRAGSIDIYRVYPDGTGLTRLTSAPGDEVVPSWSADRTRIVFAYVENDDSDLYYMEADGTSWLQLTSGGARDVHPVWAPDDRGIAFVSDRDGDWEIYYLDLESRNTRQLTFNQAWDSFPGWSPTGEWLVYTSLSTGNYDLFVIEMATGEEWQLTSSPYSDAHPAWSPYGDEIAYTMVVPRGSQLLRQIGLLTSYDLANPYQLTDSGAKHALHRYPDWSPDARWIVFESEQDGDAEVYIMPARGGEMVNISNSPGSSDTSPAWSK